NLYEWDITTSEEKESRCSMPSLYYENSLQNKRLQTGDESGYAAPRSAIAALPFARRRRISQGLHFVSSPKGTLHKHASVPVQCAKKNSSEQTKLGV
ncbi:MAG: hypothetical protein WC655_12490, partial [Candidatus Hydrogenedentales bacterium]